MPNVANRVYTTVSGTPGTGTITLGAAVSGYVTFLAAFGSTTTNIRYVLEDGSNWEIGNGTFSTSGNTLTRAVIQSSNSNLPINASSSSTVFVTLAAADYAQVDQAQTFTNKTIESVVLNNGYTEEVFTITDGTTVNLDPDNGSIQLWTLGANRTPGQVNWDNGQSITLMVDDGSSRTIDWATIGVVWKTGGGIAPTLNTTGYTVIQLWKVGGTVYGARVGDA